MNFGDIIFVCFVLNVRMDIDIEVNVDMNIDTNKAINYRLL